MPSPDTVLAGLTAIANDWRWLAITWHVLLGVSVVLLLAGWRPRVRLLGCLLVAPLLSVSLTAWLSRNPFNGTVFAILPAVLVAAVVRFPDTAVRLASFARVGLGVGFVVFGLTYPHFLLVETWSTYLYASPFGILPCPTLSVSIGSTLIFSNLGSTSWSAALAVTGFLYGAIGTLSLGVLLDSGLVVASGVLAVTAARDAARRRSIRADAVEQSRAPSGARLSTEPLGPSRTQSPSRAGRSYRFHGLPAWRSVPVARLVHPLMQRKQLLGIARRVESANGAAREEALPEEASCPSPHRTT